MPRFKLRFIGMSLFVRHKNDQQVDVRFVTASGDGSAHGSHSPMGHGAGPSDQHVPLLFMSPDSWLGTSDDDLYPGRAPGRPVYLAQYESLTIEKNGGPIGAGVAVSGAGTAPPAAAPTTAADWDNFEHLILDLLALFPGTNYSPSRSAAASPTGLIALNGGNLGAEPPSSADAQDQWQVINRMPLGPSTIVTRHFTDVATYWFDFNVGDTIELKLWSPFLGETRIQLANDRDIQGWVAHEPLAGALEPERSNEVQHLHVAGAFLDPEPDPRLCPIVRVDPNRPRLHPDDQACPPVQIQL